MPRKTGVVLLACGFALVPVAGTSGAQERQGQVELKVVWEKEFDEEIEDVVFGEAEDGSLYPRVIVFDDEVTYYGPDGSELWSLPYVRGFPPVVSRTGRYIGVVRSLSEPEEERAPREAVWGLYDARGREVTPVSYVWHYEGGSRDFYVSDTGGAFVEAHVGSQKLVFRDLDGMSVREIALFGEDYWGGHGSLLCAFSEDGEYVAALGEELPPGSRGEVDRSTHLTLFDNEGAEVWRRPLGGWMAISVSLSSRGSFAAANSWVLPEPMRVPMRMEVKLFNLQGELVGTYPARSQKFSRDERYLALASENTVFLVEAPTGVVVWSRQLPYQTDSRRGEWRWIMDVDTTPDGSVVAISSTAYEWIRNECHGLRPVVVLFGSNGQVLAREELVGTSGEGGPRVTIASDGRHVCVRGRTSISGLSLASEEVR